MLTGLKSRTLELARSPNAERTLFAISFAESSFFPLPPDLLLGPMAAAAPERWLRYALVCTIASVLGGLLGYAIGMFLMDSVGQSIIDFFGYGGRVEDMRALFSADEDRGLWLQVGIVLLKGLTPIPFKLVTIMAGAMHFSLPIFIATSIFTRGLRFLLVAWLFQRFGPAIAPVLEKRLGLVLVIVALVIVAAIVAVRFLH